MLQQLTLVSQSASPVLCHDVFNHPLHTKASKRMIVNISRKVDPESHKHEGIHKWDQGKSKNTRNIGWV